MPAPGTRPLGFLAAAAATVLAACVTVGPDYSRPEVAQPDAWFTAATDGLETGEAALQTWWTVLDDPDLDRLVERARSANLDLRAAAWRVEEARALRGVVAGERLPQVAASASAQRSEASDNGLLPPPEGGFEAQDLFDAGLGASWEIDLFGRVRRSVEAADAGAEATLELYRDVLVSLLAEVASTYVDLRSTQQRLAFARSNVAAQEETLALTRDRFDAGLVSGLDVAQAEANLASTRSLIPSLEILLERSLNRLAVLLGEVPGARHGEFSVDAPIPEPPQRIAVGLPADLLRQRPDVRRAERELAAQTARIGIATAELYPSLSLTGFLGVQATDLGDLGEGSSVTWSAGLPIRWALFSGGRIRSQVAAEEARTEQALAAYERTVLAAYEETENAMIAFEREQRRRRQLAATVDATQRSLELVLTQYRSGLTDFQNVLDTQRSLLQREDELASSEGRVVLNLIALYRALGGGWDPGLPGPGAVAEGRVAGPEGRTRGEASSR